jgi:FkbM family methyltransferase
LKKLRTYFLYLTDYLKYGDWKSVVASVKYVLNKSSHNSDRTITTSAGTFFCRKNTNDFQFANFYYEWTVKQFILKRVNEFSVFIDAGACIGEYCIILAKLNKQCFALEPMADNIKTLETNIKLNDLQDKIKVIPCGLGDSDYRASYWFDPVNTGASRIDKVSSASSGVEIRKLDSLLSELNIDQNQSILIKLDIEGMESEAIHGAAEFIRNYPRVTFIIEDKHSGQIPIKDALREMAEFEYGRVDGFNMFARKIRNI